MDILKELERFMPSEEEMDIQANDARDIGAIIATMKKKGITSLDDEKMGEILDDLAMDSDRFSSLFPALERKIKGN